MTKPRPNLAPPRGFAYVLVLGVATLLMVIGFSALAVNRIQLRTQGQGHDWDAASLLAFSAVEHALTVINADPDWRTNFTHDVPIAPVSLGGGTYEWKLRDEGDADLAAGDSDPVRIVGTATVGSSRRILSLVAQQSGQPLPVLQMAAHAEWNLECTTNDLTLSVLGGPLSTDKNFYVDGTVNGNVLADTSSGPGTVNGSLTTGASPKDMPADSVFDIYKAMATPIAWGDLDPGPANSAGFWNRAFGGSVNHVGPVNPQAIYYVFVPFRGTFQIDKSRIAATFVVECDLQAKIKIDDVRWERNGSYPALIVKGQNVDVNLEHGGLNLSEASIGANLNPPGLVEGEAGDADLSDVYTSEIFGLVHVIGSNSTVKLQDRLRLTGCILAGGEITAGDATLSSNNIHLTADPVLLGSPPPGYTAGDTMAPIPTSWRWEMGP